MGDPFNRSVPEASHSKSLDKYYECFCKYVETLQELDSYAGAQEVDHVLIRSMKDRARACIIDIRAIRGLDLLKISESRSNMTAESNPQHTASHERKKRRSPLVDCSLKPEDELGAHSRSKRRRIVKQEDHANRGPTAINFARPETRRDSQADIERRSAAVESDAKSRNEKVTTHRFKHQRSMQDESQSRNRNEEVTLVASFSQQPGVSSAYLKTESPLPTHVKVETPPVNPLDEAFAKAKTSPTRSEPRTEIRNVDLEYEDISAEVEARLRENRERRHNTGREQNKPAVKRKRGRSSGSNEGQLCSRKESLGRAAKFARVAPVNTSRTGVTV